MYECVENGVIPVYVRQRGDDAYWKMISTHLGLMEITSWDMAKNIMTILIADPTSAEIYRQHVTSKWNLWKDKLRNVELYECLKLSIA
jgi:hypothetical protein